MTFADSLTQVERGASGPTSTNGGSNPVQVGLGTLLDDVPQFNPTVGALAVQRPEIALATLLAITPVLVVFLFSQRYLVAGLLAGATKG